MLMLGATGEDGENFGEPLVHRLEVGVVACAPGDCCHLRQRRYRAACLTHRYHENAYPLALYCGADLSGSKSARGVLAICQHHQPADLVVVAWPHRRRSVDDGAEQRGVAARRDAAEFIDDCLPPSDRAQQLVSCAERDDLAGGEPGGVAREDGQADLIPIAHRKQGILNTLRYDVESALAVLPSDRPHRARHVERHQYPAPTLRNLVLFKCLIHYGSVARYEDRIALRRTVAPVITHFQEERFSGP